MRLLGLAACIASNFSMRHENRFRTVQKVKDNQPRDVVTELDLILHNVSLQFVTDRLPGCRLLSEEADSQFSLHDLCNGEWLVVDPLDGSYNLTIDMPHYGYMAAHLVGGVIDSSVVVLPERDQYIVADNDAILCAKPLPETSFPKHGSVYYAYSPALSSVERKARASLIDLIDLHSAGMYRYGSACDGLYQLLTGRHMAFIGHGVRLWDVIAFLPILAARKIQARYVIKSRGITVIAGINEQFIQAVEDVLDEEQGLALHSFDGGSLRIEPT